MRVKGGRTLKVAQQAESKGNLRLLWAFGEGQAASTGWQFGECGGQRTPMGARPS